MATRFHIGAHAQKVGSQALPANFEAYAKRFDLLEVQTGGAAAPNASTLRRWRKSVPPHFDFCVVAGPNLARLKASEALEQELSSARDAINALQARCFLLPTPSEVTPSALWRERFGKLLERFPRDATHIVWEPRGVWETDDAAIAAKKWGIVLSVDASREPVPPGPTAYLRLRALGETRSFGAAALERIVEAVGVRRDAYVIFETPSALQETKLLRKLAQESQSGTKGGLGRLVRPRGSMMKVRDDEQE